MYLQKFLTTFFVFSMVFFHRGGQICSQHRYGGGQNPYFSTKSQYYHCSFCPGGGAKLHCQFRWGAMAGFAPPGSATGLGITKIKALEVDNSVLSHGEGVAQGP